MSDEHEVPAFMAPRGRLPNLTYFGKVLAVYAMWAALGGILIFVAMVVYAFPLDIIMFIAGIVFAILGQKVWRAGIGRFVARRVRWEHPA